MSFAPATPGTWARHRPAPLLPPSLAALHGPTHGTWHAPLRVQWSGRRDYDLSDDEDLVWLYSRTIREASSMDDLVGVLDGPTLVRLWPQLQLPVEHVRAWQDEFAVLPRPSTTP